MKERKPKNTPKNKIKAGIQTHAVRKKVVQVHKKETEKPKPETLTSPRKLKLLITVVNSGKAEFYADLLQSLEVNMQLSLTAKGTASSETLGLLGLSETGKTVLIGVIREDRAAEALSLLEEKFRTIKNGKGIAYTVPLTSAVGVAIYRFLSNTVQ